LPGPNLLGRIASLANDLDPAFLVLFAVAATIGRPSPRAIAFVLAPSALLVFASFVPVVTFDVFRAAYVGVVLVGYLVGFAILLRALLKAPAPREDLGALVVAFAPVALPRLGLAYIDLGLAQGLGARASPKTLFLDAGLLVAFLAFALACRLFASKDAWPWVRSRVLLAA